MARVGLALAALATSEASGSPDEEERVNGDRAASLFRLLNPIYRSLEAEDLERYRVEPYVQTGDIAGPSPHVGRGGWTWYTGSAGWYRRFGLEGILGLRVEDGQGHLVPCISHAWAGYRIDLRRGDTVWQIRVENPRRVSCGIASLTLDDHPQSDLTFPLTDDGRTHQVHVVLGPRTREAGREIGPDQS